MAVNGNNARIDGCYWKNARIKSCYWGNVRLKVVTVINMIELNIIT